MNTVFLPLLLTFGLIGQVSAETLTLTISTDAPCTVLFDDAPMGPIEPGSPRTLEAPAGWHVVACQSLEFPPATATEERGGSGTQSIRFTPANTWTRFAVDGSGWLADAETGLRWKPQGSENELGWAAAGAWCQSLGGRLPSRKELQQLHVHGQDRTPCGDGLYCGIPHRISLASRFVWTGEEFEGDQALISGLAGQRPSAQSVAKDQPGVRALCVTGGS